MKQKQERLPLVGVSALLTVFAVLCLTVFALLSLSTALAEQRLNQATLEAVEEYYAAEEEAQEILARLRSGEQVPGVEEREGSFCYSVAVAEDQVLQVEVERGSWKVLRWQTVVRSSEEEPGLPVWDGK